MQLIVSLLQKELARSFYVLSCYHHTINNLSKRSLLVGPMNIAKHTRIALLNNSFFYNVGLIVVFESKILAGSTLLTLISEGWG